MLDPEKGPVTTTEPDIRYIIGLAKWSLRTVLAAFDEHVKDVLQRTFAEAQHLEVDTIGSEHVLLAVLAADHGTGVLAGLGVTPEAIETQLRAAR